MKCQVIFSLKKKKPKRLKIVMCYNFILSISHSYQNTFDVGDHLANRAQLLKLTMSFVNVSLKL